MHRKGVYLQILHGVIDCLISYLAFLPVLLSVAPSREDRSRCTTAFKVFAARLLSSVLYLVACKTSLLGEESKDKLPFVRPSPGADIALVRRFHLSMRSCPSGFSAVEVWMVQCEYLRAGCLSKLGVGPTKCE